MSICGLVLLWGIAVTCGGQTNAVHHRFRFFLEPELAAPYAAGELRSRLALYVEDREAPPRRQLDLSVIAKAVVDAVRDVEARGSGTKAGVI